MRHHILAVFAAIMLLLFGCAQTAPPVSVNEPGASVPVPPPEKSTTAASPCSGGNIVQNDNCFAALAVAKSDPKYCRSIYSIDILDSCLYHFAASSLDICKQVTNAALRFSCLTANALREESESICNLIDNTDAAANCLRQVLPPCMLIPGESERSLCIALDKSDFSLCKGDACLAAYAQNKSDTLACGAITTQIDRYVCLATVKKSVISCKDASLVPVQDYCIELASEALGDLSGCDLASGLSTDKNDYRNRCYTYFASLRADPSICQRAEPESARDACYKNYSIETATSNACPKVVESTNRADCYFKAAKLNRKPSLCNMLWTNDLKNTCYSGAILYPAEGPVPSDCPGVSSSDWRDKCYYQAARATYNASLCDEMSPTASDLRNCHSLFN